MEQECNFEETGLLMLLPLLQKIVHSESGVKERGMTKTRIIIFAALVLRGSLTMGQVAGYIGSSKEQATRAVAPLVEAGYVERYVKDENRSKIHIRLTDAGKAITDDRIGRFSENLNEKMNQRLSREELQTLFDTVNTLINLLDRLV